MKELTKKVFLTIFWIFSFFIFISLVIMNIYNYRREYENVERNLFIMDNRGKRFDLGGPEGFDGKDMNPEEVEPKDLNNMMIMDYDVYTVEVSDGKVADIFTHGNESEDFDVTKAAEEILGTYGPDTLKVENLYKGNYSFNYKITFYSKH